MFILGYFFLALAYVLNVVLSLYMLVLLARAVLSWLPVNRYNPIVRFIYAISEPVLYQVRRRVPVVWEGFDFSPVIVFLVIIFLRIFLVNTLSRLAALLL